MDSSLIIDGKRKRVSTTITIQGHKVLKSNNYSLESGEKSVWDRELNVDECYVEHESDAAEVAIPWKKIKRPEDPQQANTAPRNGNKYAAHNASIKEAIFQSELSKKMFIREHWNLLSPFLDQSNPPEILETVQSTAPFTPMVVQPSYLNNVTMRDYQLTGLNWLCNSFSSGVNVILGDEMGLGKTIQTISFLGWIKYIRHLSGPFLVMVPLSVLTNWMSEFKRFLPEMRVMRLHSADVAERERLKRELKENLLTNWDVVVTTYEMVKNPEMKQSLITHIYWRAIVLDEGHLIRNENSIIARAVRHMHYQHALLLTGTPLQNNLHELWSLLNFLHPSIFEGPEKFDACFNIRDQDNYVIDRALLMKVHDMLKPFMLRRIKADVERTVPPKVEKKVLCPMTSTQALWYKKFLLKDSSLLLQLELEGIDRVRAEEELSSTSKTSRWKKLQALYMQLRKICNHPYLIEDADPDPEFTTHSIIEASGKLQVLDRMLMQLQARGHRVVIFSQFTSVLDILSDYLSLRQYEFCRLDGSTNRVQRQIHINSFNAPNSPLFIFLLSTRAGGLGVNLQTADTVVLYDSDWNPQMDLQAMARVHRIGQKNVVHVYRLVSEGTVEERIVQRAEKKLFLDQMVNRDGLKNNGRSGDEKDDDGTGLGESELLDMLRFGAHEICGSGREDKKLTNEEIANIISRPAGAAINNRSALTHQLNAKDFDPKAKPIETRLFQGKRYEKNDFGSYGEQKDFTNCKANMSDIGIIRQEQELRLKSGSRRERRTRLEEITDEYGKKHRVLRENMYDMDQGITSVFDSELRGDTAFRSRVKDTKRRIQVAGRDYENEDFCLVCRDGGDLLLCDRCPASYHQACIGVDMNLRRGGINGTWLCPHHRCQVCNRTPSAAGGLIFRCSECSNAFCEDHLPEDAKIIGRCFRMESYGYHHPTQACYVNCCLLCEQYMGNVKAATKEAEIDGVHMIAEDLSEEEAYPSHKPEVIELIEDDEAENSSALNTDLEVVCIDSLVSGGLASSDCQSSSSDAASIAKPPVRADTFVSIIESMEECDELGDEGSSKVALDLMKLGLPLHLGAIRCEACLQFHENGKCSVRSLYLSKKDRAPDPLIDEMLDSTISLADREDKFILSLFCYCNSRKQGEKVGFVTNLKHACRFRDSCPVYNFGEVLVSLLKGHWIASEPSLNGFIYLFATEKTHIRFTELEREKEEKCKLADEKNHESLMNFVIDVIENPRPFELLNNQYSSGLNPQYAWSGYCGGRPFTMRVSTLMSCLRTQPEYLKFFEVGYFWHKRLANGLLPLLQRLKNEGKLFFSEEVPTLGSVISLPLPEDRIEAQLRKDEDLMSCLEQAYMSALPQAAPAGINLGTVLQILSEMSPRNPWYVSVVDRFGTELVTSLGSLAAFAPPAVSAVEDKRIMPNQWFDKMTDRLLEKGEIEFQVNKGSTTVWRKGLSLVVPPATLHVSRKLSTEGFETLSNLVVDILRCPIPRLAYHKEACDSIVWAGYHDRQPFSMVFLELYSIIISSASFQSIYEPRDYVDAAQDILNIIDNLVNLKVLNAVYEYPCSTLSPSTVIRYRATEAEYTSLVRSDSQVVDALSAIYIMLIPGATDVSVGVPLNYVKDSFLKVDSFNPWYVFLCSKYGEEYVQSIKELHYFVPMAIIESNNNISRWFEKLTESLCKARLIEVVLSSKSVRRYTTCLTSPIKQSICIRGPDTIAEVSNMNSAMEHVESIVAKIAALPARSCKQSALALQDATSADDVTVIQKITESTSTVQDENLLSRQLEIYDEAEVFEVERISQMRGPVKSRRRLEFLTHWVGYDQPSWTPYENLKNNKCLHDFLKTDSKLIFLIPKAYR